MPIANILNFLQVEGLSMLHHCHVDTKLQFERKTCTENIFMEKKMLIRNSLRPVSKFYAYYSSYNFTSFHGCFTDHFHIETLTRQTCSEEFFVALLPRYLPSTWTSIFVEMFIRNFPAKPTSKFYVIIATSSVFFLPFKVTDVANVQSNRNTFVFSAEDVA